MNKKIILRLLLVATVSLFFLNSCRTDEMMQEEKRTEREKIEAFVRFENNLTTQKNNSEYISYHKPFQEIIQAFLNKNPTFAQKFQNEVGDIYFDLRSLTYGKTSKVIAYPIMKDDKVNAFLIGVINPQRDWVNFTVAKDNTPEVQRIISKFQNFYNLASVTSRSREKEQAIEEIVIVVDSPGGGSTGVTFPYIDHNGFGSGMSGGGPVFGGGSSGGGQTIPPLNPCQRTQFILERTEAQAKIKELKEHAPKGGELGVKFKYDRTPSETIVGGAHSVNFGDKTGYAGGYHNHTPTGIPMLSPPDIEQLLQFVLAQGDNGDPSYAYIGMVAPNGMHYVATFKGEYKDALKSYSQQDLDTFTSDFETRNYLYQSSKTPEGLEKLFFKTLSDMKLDGMVSLQRVESDGTIKTVTKDNNGVITATPCS